MCEVIVVPVDDCACPSTMARVKVTSKDEPEGAPAGESEDEGERSPRWTEREGKERKGKVANGLVV